MSGERLPDALPQPDPKAPPFIAKPLPGTVIPKPKKVAPIMTATERRLKRLDAEAREDAQRLEQLKLDLKGRDYTYDTHGTVIPMEDLHPDRLPAVQQPRPPGAACGRRRGSRGREGRGGGPKPPPIEFGANSSFKNLDSLQPSLLETTTMSDGVTLTQGEASKGGEPRVFDGERMSKEVFEQVANMSGGFVPRRPVGDDPAAGSTNPLGATDRPPPTPAGAGTVPSR